MARIDGQLFKFNSVPGAVLLDAAEILQAQMKQRPNDEFPIRATDWRVWSAMGTNLPNTPLTDDLGIVTGTWGTDDFTIETEDLGAAGATSSYAATIIAVPANYDTAKTVTVTVRAGMETAVSDNTATIDFEMHRPDGDGTLSADLITTDPTSINSLTEADYTFGVTSTTIVPGDILLLRMHIAVNDAATPVTSAVVYDCSVLFDTRG